MPPLTLHAFYRNISTQTSSPPPKYIPWKNLSTRQNALVIQLISLIDKITATLKKDPANIL